MGPCDSPPSHHPPKLFQLFVLSDEQLEAVRRTPCVTQLRKERLRLRDETRSLAGTVEVTPERYPELCRKHGEACKRLEKVRRSLRPEAKEDMKEESYDDMQTIEVDKQVDQLLDNQDAGLSDTKDEDEGWNSPILEYVFQERTHIVEALYGPEVETWEGDLALARRIQVTKDMTALCRKARSLGWTRSNIQPMGVLSVRVLAAVLAVIHASSGASIP